MKKIRILVLLVACVLSLSVFVSCTGGDSIGKWEDGAEAPGMGNGSVTIPDDGRKIIREYFITLETKEFDETIAALDAAMAAVGGYVENSTIRPGTEEGSRGYATLEIAIPTEHVSAFNASIEGIGHITEHQVTTQDVTLTYSDLEARIESLTAELEKLNEFYANAHSTSELMDITARRSQVAGELKSYQNQLAVLEKRIEMTSYHFTVQDVKEYTEELGFFARIGRAFPASFSSFGEFMQELIIVCIYLLPYGLALLVAGAPVVVIVIVALVILAVLLAVVIVLLLVIRRRRRRKQVLAFAAMMEEQADDASETVPEEAEVDAEADTETEDPQE